MVPKGVLVSKLHVMWHFLAEFTLLPYFWRETRRVYSLLLDEGSEGADGFSGWKIEPG